MYNKWHAAGKLPKVVCWPAAAELAELIVSADNSTRSQRTAYLRILN